MCTGNRCDRRTCSHTLIVAAELPSVGAGAHVGRVAWFAELGAAVGIVHDAQSLIYTMETEGEVAATRMPNEK